MAALLFLVLAIACSLGVAQERRQSGGGAFAYSDSNGQRYSGTYGLRDGQVVHSTGDYPVPFADAAYPGYGYGYSFPGYGFPGEDFYPNYFANLDNLLQDRFGRPEYYRTHPFRRTFRSNLETQRLAYDAARKAFELSSNQAGYYPNFATRFPQPPYNDFGRFGGFGRYGGYPPYSNFDMPNFASGGYPNSAFASAAVGPGYRQQVASVNPPNPNSPNVNVNTVNRYSDTSAPGRGNFYHVASKSFSSSSNVNGQEVSHKGAETIVNDNGKITKYRVGD